VDCANDFSPLKSIVLLNTLGHFVASTTTSLAASQQTQCLAFIDIYLASSGREGSSSESSSDDEITPIHCCSPNHKTPMPSRATVLE
jgi:hypothetical protein